MPDQTLAQRVRAKFPGVYDDLSDADLESKVKAKFPGVYDDLPTSQAGPSASPAAQTHTEQPHSVIGDLAIGVTQGIGNTLVGMGEMVHKIPGVSQAVDALYGTPGLSKQAFQTAREGVKPQNTTQAIGQGVEQIGEFFLPTGATGKVAKAAEVAKAGLLGTAQTGSTGQGAASAAIQAAAGPVSSVLARGAVALKDSAERSVVRALGPTKEWAKATAEKIAPDMIERGVRGTRAAMLERATAETNRVGAAIGATVKQAAEAGTTVPGADLMSAINGARQAITTTTATGAPAVIPGAETVAKTLDRLDQFVTSLGPDIPVDKAAHVKTLWDRIVSKAGLYGQKANASATDQAKAWATREAASSMRKVINSASPDIAELNEEYVFWKGLKDVLKATELRTQPQSAGLSSTIMSSVGAGAGFASGDSFGDRAKKAAEGAALGKAVSLMQSPYWRTTVAAPFKTMLANALASGSNAEVSRVVTKIVSAMPAQMRPALAQ